MSEGTPKPATCPRCLGPAAYGHATAIRIRCDGRFGKTLLRAGLGRGHLTEGVPGQTPGHPHVDRRPTPDGTHCNQGKPECPEREQEDTLRDAAWVLEALRRKSRLDTHGSLIGNRARGRVGCLRLSRRSPGDARPPSRRPMRVSPATCRTRAHPSDVRRLRPGTHGRRDRPERTSTGRPRSTHRRARQPLGRNGSRH